jgi:hypothetical protein
MIPSFRERYGPWALVTGASAGIGEELARQLAAQGLSVLLAARRIDRLEALASSLARDHGVEARAVAVDLAERDFFPVLEAAIGDRELGFVACNAGFGDKGSLLDAPLDEHLRMLDVNCRSTLVLVHRLGRRLRARGRGAILITSSTAAFSGVPWSAHYAATKGWGLQLAEGLAHELRPHGVDVLALCPGGTDTEGPKRTGVQTARLPVKLMPVAPVVRAALDGLGRDTVVVPGALNRAGVLLARVLPRSAMSALAGRVMARAIGK